MHTWETQPHDLNILRTLAERKAEIAEEEANKERRRLWYALDEGTSERPMVLAESWVSFEDLPDATLHCRAEWARKLEHDLRFEIFVFERIRDDHVVEPFINLNWDVTCSNFGVEVRTEWAGRVSGNVSSRRWEPPIKNIDRDSHLLRARNYTVDRKKTLAWKAHLDEVFKGILPTRIRGGFWWTMGMTAHAIELIGLENYMLYTCTDPEGLHRLMAFLRDDHLAYADWLEQEGLLSLNNENDYIGSGSMGYTHALPQDGNGGTSAVRLQDLWVLVESQESVGLSPDMLQEFVFPYHKTLAEQFGRTLLRLLRARTPLLEHNKTTSKPCACFNFALVRTKKPWPAF